MGNINSFIIHQIGQLQKECQSLTRRYDIKFDGWTQWFASKMIYKIGNKDIRSI